MNTVYRKIAFTFVLLALASMTRAGVQLRMWTAPPLGSATENSPLAWEMDKGNMRPNFSITNLPAWNPLLETQSQASKRKATAMAIEIRRQFPNSNTRVISRMLWFRLGRRWVSYRQWGVLAPGFKGARYTAADPTREPGNGLQLLRIPGGNARPSMGSMGRSSSGRSEMTFSTGVDPNGEQSVVMFGFYTEGSETVEEFERYIALIEPEADWSDLDILRSLQSELWDKGVDSTIDLSRGVLQLDDLLTDGQVLFWGSTDTGLDLRGSITIPAPSSAILLALGTAVCWRRRGANEV